MKIKTLTTLALLFVLNFSIVHEYVFAAFDDGHSTVTEYISEVEAPSHHSDLCDIHFEYHQSYLLSNNIEISKLEHSSSKIKTDKESYTFQTLSTFFKPPIV